MDDFNVSSLHESKNEWSARLVTILTPLIKVLSCFTLPPLMIIIIINYIMI